MITPEVEKLWYQALFEEDCLWVRELLKKDSGLLKSGWKSDQNRLMDKSPDSYWKGRTALHVGTRRGDVQLIKQVLKLCGLRMDEQGENEENEQGPETFSSVKSGDNIVDYPGQSAQGERDGAKRNGKDVDCTSISEGEKIDGFVSLEGGLKSKRDSRQALEKYKRSLPGLSSTRSRKKNREANAGLPDSLVSKRELRELLVSKDGQYELDALAMVTIQGNVDIAVLLVYALGVCDNPPYLITRTGGFSPQALTGKYWARSELPKVTCEEPDFIVELPKVTREVIDYFRMVDPDFIAACEEEYGRHLDFNFLPIEVYLFHFSWTSRFEDVFHEEDKDLFRREFWSKVRRWPDKETPEVQDNLDEKKKPEVQESVGEQKKLDEQEKRTEQERPDEQKNHVELWRFLLTLHDGQGRPPFHVAVDEGTERSFMLVVGGISNFYHLGYPSDNRDATACAATAPDGSGIEPAHRAAVMGKNDDYSFDTWRIVCRVKGVIALSCEKSEHPLQGALNARNVSSFNLGLLSVDNGFREFFFGSTAQQAAIIHNSYSLGRVLIPFAGTEALKTLYWVEHLNVDIMELVCVVGADVSWLRLLLEMAIKYIAESKANDFDHLCPLLHLIATYGNYEALKFVMDDQFCDHFVVDEKENTPLHCVMKDGALVQSGAFAQREFQFKTHLLDYVGCRHLRTKDQRKLEKTVDDAFIADRQGCVELLLQAGCDIFKSNKRGEVPYPQGRLSSNTKFLSWWYEKQAKEFGVIQNSLNNAANAISVTATLVATASFVGPLQPPRSYTVDNQIDYENSWVAIFFVCDTFSFYLAIVAIVFSLIPSLPVPQQPMFIELRRTRRMVTLAVGVLFPAIVNVVIAFAASSMAVVTPTITSSLGRNLAVTSMSIGGLYIVGGFVFFAIRLLGIFFPRNSWIKFPYKLTSF